MLWANERWVRPGLFKLDHGCARQDICWNCRGARSDDFIREMKEFMRSYKPIIILLMEPRRSGEIADEICNKLGKNKWIRADAEGFSGGVWCLWDEEDVKVELKYAHSYFIYCWRQQVDANRS